MFTESEKPNLALSFRLYILSGSASRHPFNLGVFPAFQGYYSSFKSSIFHGFWVFHCHWFWMIFIVCVKKPIKRFMIVGENHGWKLVMLWYVVYVFVVSPYRRTLVWLVESYSFQDFYLGGFVRFYRANKTIMAG